ncbi:MAG: tetratricopeptide repeat protein [Ignavibacteria bacterium]|nr:tetratricopeptide repeat protein [Ignavibacteria bacterium]
MTHEEWTLRLSYAETACKNGYNNEANIIVDQLLALLQALPEVNSDFLKSTAVEMLARSLVRLASTNLTRNDTASTLLFATPGLRLADELGNEQVQADLLNMIGIVYRSQEEYHLALEYMQKALVINTKLGNQRMMAGNFHNIGDMYEHFSEYALALDYLQSALKINEDLDNNSWAALNLARIALVYSRLQEYDQALEYYEQARALHAELGNQSEEVAILTNMSLVYHGLKDFMRALELLHQALSIAQSTGSRRHTADIYINIGSMYSSLSEFTTSLEYIHQALAIFKEIDVPSGIAVSCGAIGEVYANGDFEGYNPENAEEYLFQSIGIFEQSGDKQQLYALHNSLASMYEREKRWEEFAVHFKKYHTLEKEVMSNESRKIAERYIRERQDAEREKTLAVERALSQATSTILANILPQTITERLVKGEKKIANTHEHVSVLFIDIVGFTQLSAQLSAHELIDLLDLVFTRFDMICKKHGLEKIKTIGDAYMAVCGAPVSCDNHAERVALAALEMLEDFPIGRDFSTNIDLGFRIGLHSGSVVAGIIGENKYSYDMWGDAVNTASRMESHGEKDKIHVSEEFMKKLLMVNGEWLIYDADNFSSLTINHLPLTIIPRGEMHIKGKGMMKTYFLEQSI